MSPDLVAGAQEHKPALLALLPPEPLPPDEADVSMGAIVEGVSLLLREEAEAARRDEQEERKAIVAEGDDEVHPLEVLEACDEMQRIIDPLSLKRDWRIDWLVELGILMQRFARCDDDAVCQRLLSLAVLSPKDQREWNAYRMYIGNVEAELREQGKLPRFHWPRP